jgi:hypothetical protein
MIRSVNLLLISSKFHIPQLFTFLTFCYFVPMDAFVGLAAAHAAELRVDRVMNRGRMRHLHLLIQWNDEGQPALANVLKNIWVFVDEAFWRYLAGPVRVLGLIPQAATAALLAVGIARERLDRRRE